MVSGIEPMVLVFEEGPDDAAISHTANACCDDNWKGQCE